MSNTTYIFIGTADEARIFRGLVEDDPAIEGIKIDPPRKRVPSSDQLEVEPFGQGEIVEMAIHFATSVAAHATVELVHALFKRFKQAHKATELRFPSDKDE